MKQVKIQPKTIINYVLILMSAFLIRSFIFTPVTVLGISMEPTYHESDRVWQSSLITPKRFSIATFPSPRNGKNIIKRVIGLPGDTIRMENDKLYINDKFYEEPYLEQEKKQLQDGLFLTKNFTLKNLTATNSEVVPEGCYFVLGDNRRAADDSRYFGFVNADDIRGIVHFRYYPLDKIGLQ